MFAAGPRHSDSRQATSSNRRTQPTVCNRNRNALLSFPSLILPYKPLYLAQIRISFCPFTHTLSSSHSPAVMTSSAKRRLQAVSKQLVEGIPDAGTFENIPRIREVAQDSTGPYVYDLSVLEWVGQKLITPFVGTSRVKDKVVIVTGTAPP